MYTPVEKPKNNDSSELTNAVAQQKNNVKQGVKFVDNRSRWITQKKPKETQNHFQPKLVKSMGKNNSAPIQKVHVESVKQKNTQSSPNKPYLSPDVFQLVSVDVARGIPQGSAVSEALLQTAIDTMRQIVEAAEGAKGKANSGPEHQRLMEILGKQELQKELPSSSSSTYGLGGSNYFGNTPFTTTQGTEDFGTAVSSVAGIGRTEYLGGRATGVHDEMHHISHYPGLQALASSQGHCFFCYGTIHARGYEHGDVRATDPWPQDWQHDYLGFKLKKTSAAMDSIAHTFDPVIKITSDTKGTRYYFVSKAG